MLNVVGGTYVETCLLPEWFELFGSGLRAAITARALGTDVHFSTYIDDSQVAALQAKASERLIAVNSIPTSPTIRFSYPHPLAAPVIIPPPHAMQKPEAIEIHGDNVLRFGMLEGDAKVSADRVVYDPQDPYRPQPFTANGSSATRLAICANLSEARILSGERKPDRAASTLLEKFGCAATVVKCGSYGCFVCDSSRTENVPAFKTNRAWLIGSGDVFAGAFAKYWACDGIPPIQAAEFASKAAACYSNSMDIKFPVGFPASVNFEPFRPKDGPRRRVYLAGPFFNLCQNWLIEQAFEGLESQNLSVFSPLHHVGRGSADDIYERDIKGVRECDIVFACVDGLDSGTLYEIGFARSLNKPVVAYVENETRESLKMLEGSGCLIEKDFATAIYRTNWVANL